MIKLGVDKFNDKKEVIWQPSSVINPHWLILGVSGSGKTYNITRVLDSIQGIRAFVFDVHGDIDTNPQRTSSVTFGNSSQFGFNPLQVNSDPEFGGVTRKLQTFTSMVNRYSCKLGINQESVLRSLLLDLYAANNIYPDDPSSWRKDKQPTLSDLKRFTYSKLKSIIIGGDNKTITAISKLNKSVISMNRKLKDSSIDEDEINTAKAVCKDAFCDYIDNIQTGREVDDFIKYDSKDTLKGIYNRIDKLANLSIFKDKNPGFDQSLPVWRYDIRSLTDEEQGYLVEMYLEKVFLYYKQQGVSTTVKSFVVIDEAHKFIDESKGHIINILMREARKFGLGVILASHSLSHFSEDVLTNCATKLILGIDEMHQEGVAKKLGIELKRLRYIQPRRTAVVQLKGKDFTAGNNRFVDVVL